MALESPSTYSEWYWKHSIDANAFRSKEREDSYSPVISQILNDLGIQDLIPASLSQYFSILSSPPAPDWDEAQRAFLGLITRAVTVVAGDELARPFQYETAEKLQTLRIDPETATTLQLRKKISDDLYMGRMHSAGYADSEIAHYYNSRVPYPAFPDIIEYARYHGDPYNPKGIAWDKFTISPDDWPLWEWLSIQKLNTEQVLSLYKRKFWDDYKSTTELARLGWRREDNEAVLNLAYSLPNPMLMIQGELLEGYTKEAIIADVERADIHPMYSNIYWDAVLTKPATQDLIAYELRRDPSLTNLSSELTKIGIHPNYHPVYKELAYQIPPVADIITMAVREAFTPAIAARFGQYEDLPTPYVEWVQKKGLSKEWAERYWAAHWSLPSPQQGFEMLHRGVIGEGDLNMLLRALDIMPFWRDKLTQIAYRPLSRVDVRRMFALGVIDKAGVYKAYTDLGYNAYNADLMTKFTVAYTRGIEEREEAARERAKAVATANWTTAQTLTFLKAGLITTERAIGELTVLGFDKEHRDIYIKSVTPKEE